MRPDGKITPSLPAASEQAVKDEPGASAADTSSGDAQSNDAATTPTEEQATRMPTKQQTSKRQP